MYHILHLQQNQIKKFKGSFFKAEKISLVLCQTDNIDQMIKTVESNFYIQYTITINVTLAT